MAETNGFAFVSPPGSDPDARTTKLAQLVARQIVDDIVKRGWPVNESLGAEPDLMARYAVSRAVLREAIRLVEHMGMATMRRGPRGGLIVTASSVSAVTDAIAIYLETAVVNLDDLAEARVVLEVQATRLAADRLDTAGTEALLRVPMEAEGYSYLETGEQDLHLAIAQATGNPVLLLFIDALCRLERRYMTAGWSEERLERMHVTTSLALAQSHRAIADAVISGDGLLARHRMLTHLEAGARFVRRHANDPSEDPEWPSVGSESADPPTNLAAEVSAVSSDGRKLGEVTAARIRRDIARRRAPVGTNLGSESVLLASYGVSRSVLREAVRLLEYHSVARMRRGPGGGLIVVKSDPEAVIRAVALYLQSVRVDLHSLYEARDIIELASVAYLVERLEPGAADALREVLKGERDGVVFPADQGFARLHAAIAELTGNRILSLFTRILLALTGIFPADQSDADQIARRRHHAHETHEDIVAAILAGDSALARRRTRVHLWELEKQQTNPGGQDARDEHAEGPDEVDEGPGEETSDAESSAISRSFPSPSRPGQAGRQVPTDTLNEASALDL